MVKVSIVCLGSFQARHWSFNMKTELSSDSLRYVIRALQMRSNTLGIKLEEFQEAILEGTDFTQTQVENSIEQAEELKALNEWIITLLPAVNNAQEERKNGAAAFGQIQFANAFLSLEQSLNADEYSQVSNQS